MKIFIASPGDVTTEREIVKSVAARLNAQYRGRIEIEVYDWSHHAIGANQTFKAGIPQTETFDVVVSIFWSRVGSLDPTLPTMDAVLKTLQANGAEISPGEPFPSNTGYEVLTALEAFERHGSPKVMNYRRIDPRPRSGVVGDLEEAKNEDQNQKALHAFYQRWFEYPGDNPARAHHRYGATASGTAEDQFKTLLQNHLRDHIKGVLSLHTPSAALPSPFKGLEHFDYKDRHVFFGRGQKTARAAQDLLQVANAAVLTASEDSVRRARLPVLFVVGSSGSGKSSLMRAGIAPHLTESGIVPEVDEWRIAVFRPSSGRTTGLFTALAKALVAEGTVKDDPGGFGPALPELLLPSNPHDLNTQRFVSVDALSKALEQHQVDRLRAMIAELPRSSENRPAGHRLLLLIDQFEEVFAPSFLAERDRFTQLLEALARPSLGPNGTLSQSNIWIVATMRSDHYPDLVNQMIRLKDAGAVYDLAPPREHEVAEILHDSAKAAGVVYERLPGLTVENSLTSLQDAAIRQAPTRQDAIDTLQDTDQSDGVSLDELMVYDAAGRDVLPLLQFALREMHDGLQVISGEVKIPGEEGAQIFRFTDYKGLDYFINAAGNRAVESVTDAAKGTLHDIVMGLVGLPERSQHETLEQRQVSIRVRDINAIAATPAAQQMLDALIEARIVQMTGGRVASIGDRPAALDDVRVPTIQFAHERVIEAWEMAWNIVKRRMRDLENRATIESRMQRWQQEGEPGTLLLTNRYLVEAARAWRRSGVMPLSMMRFVDRSVRRAFWVRWSIRGIAVFAIVGLTGLSLMAVDQARQARESEGLALSSVDRLPTQMFARLEEVEGITPEAKLAVLDRVSHLTDELERSQPTVTSIGRVYDLLFPPDGIDTSEKIADIRATIDLSTGRVLRELRAFEDAGQKIEGALEMRERLLAAAPDSPERQIKLADAVELWGDQRSFDHPDEAILEFERALEIREALASKVDLDLQNRMLAQIGQAKLHSRIGDAYLRKSRRDGDERAWPKARSAYLRALSITVPGATRNPDQIEWWDELGWNLAKFGDMLLMVTEPGNQLDSARAKAALMGSLCAREKIFDSFKTIVEAHRDVSYAMQRLAKWELKFGQTQTALDHYYLALDHTDQIVSKTPGQVEYQGDKFKLHLDMFKIESEIEDRQASAFLHAVLALELNEQVSGDRYLGMRSKQERADVVQTLQAYINANFASRIQAARRNRVVWFDSDDVQAAKNNLRVRQNDYINEVKRRKRFADRGTSKQDIEHRCLMHISAAYSP